MSMESVNAQKLLPIFHNISHEETVVRKPAVLGHLGINSSIYCETNEDKTCIEKTTSIMG